MSKITIVIVEDEEELRENLFDLLEFKSYNVIAYVSIEAFLENIDSLSIDLAFLDHQLPGLNGIEALPMIKEIKPNLPIAIVTASCQKDTFEEAMSNGANRIIHKPYEHAEIFQAVEEMLKG
jgi:DNA-binding NtrC family response regulator